MGILPIPRPPQNIFFKSKRVKKEKGKKVKGTLKENNG